MDEPVNLIDSETREVMPPILLARLYSQPPLGVRTGSILVFSHAQELVQLRRSPAIRKYLDQILSSHIVPLPPGIDRRFMEMIWRRHIHLERKNEKGPPVPAGLRHHGRAPHSTQLLLSRGEPRPNLEVIEEYRRLEQTLDIFYYPPAQNSPSAAGSHRS